MTSSSIYAAEVFNFDVTEVEIIEGGNKFLGKNGGTATSEDGTVIKAKNFEYDKIKNILIAFGNVEIIDEKENIFIKSNKITYLKNTELIFTNWKSKAISTGIIIDADNFEYNKIKKIPAMGIYPVLNSFDLNNLPTGNYELCIQLINKKNEIAIKMPADPKAVRSLNLACKVCIIKSSETKIEKIPKRTPIYRGFIE